MLLKLEKSLSLTQQFNSMCVFQILLAAFIDPHNKFNTSPLAECYYCQVPGMQSSVPLMMHKPERDIVCFLFFFLSRTEDEKQSGNKMRGKNESFG